MSPSIILHQSTKSIFDAYSERELTFEVNLPTNLGELTFKNTSKWVIDHIGVAGFQAKVLKTFQVAPSSLGSGWSKRYLFPAWLSLPITLPRKEGTTSDVSRTFT